MEDLRIVFMGTPYFAVPSLQALIKNNYNIVAVVTAPDKPAGRGRKLHMSAVKIKALNNNLKVLQPTNLKSDEFLKSLINLKVNLQIVVAFRMLPKQIWQLPKYGTFNLHASLLPNYRGAAPINWAIINGEKKTGVTTFFIDDKIDTGVIIKQIETNINPDENAGNLHDRLMILGSKLVLDTVKAIQNQNIITKPQQNKLTYTAPKLNSDTCKINWQEDILTIHNKVRGLSPYPAAWCFLKNDAKKIKLKLYKTTIENVAHNYKTGSLIYTKKTLKVACKNGWLYIKELQLAGKKKMEVQDFINGYIFTEGAILL